MASHWEVRPIPECRKKWDEWMEHDHLVQMFGESHPWCGYDPDAEHKGKKPAGTAGMGAYATAPYLAWSGWRLRVPGGPVGGQYHGFIAPDDTNDGTGWPAGHDETFRTMDNPAGLGTYPWEQWDPQWGGIPLNEGETVSDYVYRGPAEIRPRANASGGVNTIRATQTGRSAGYAIAPGNYKGIGYMMPGFRTNGGGGWAPPNMGPIRYGSEICPPWGCGGPPACPRYMLTECPPGQTHARGGPPCYTPGPCQGPTVPQLPPPSTPQPGPIVPMGPGGSYGCPSGQYRDAAGNCTADWSHPSPLYLPVTPSPSPAPTVGANTCPTGYTLDNNGNCVAPGASGSGITAWLGADTTIGSVNIPNYLLAGAAALVAFKFLGGKR